MIYAKIIIMNNQNMIQNLSLNFDLSMDTSGCHVSDLLSYKWNNYMYRKHFIYLIHIYIYGNNNL